MSSYAMDCPRVIYGVQFKVLFHLRLSRALAKTLGLGLGIEGKDIGLGIEGWGYRARYIGLGIKS